MAFGGVRGVWGAGLVTVRTRPARARGGWTAARPRERQAKGWHIKGLYTTKQALLLQPWALAPWVILLSLLPVPVHWFYPPYHPPSAFLPNRCAVGLCRPCWCSPSMPVRARLAG